VRRIYVHALVGCGVLVLTALVVVGGLISSPTQAGVAVAQGKAEVSGPSGPISAIQSAVRGGQRTSRDSERAALIANATLVSAKTERRVLAKEKEQRAIDVQQTFLEKKAAAEKKAAQKRKAEEARKKKIAREKARKARIKKLGYQPGTTNPKTMARQILKNRYGYGSGQFACFNNIIMRESAWNVHATNASSGAYGIPQALPGSKMASAGSDWRTNPATQIIWGVQYMKSTYGSPCAAWSFKSSHGWY
jgi:Transglycosylase SLT domain